MGRRATSSKSADARVETALTTAKRGSVLAAGRSFAKFGDSLSLAFFRNAKPLLQRNLRDVLSQTAAPDTLTAERAAFVVAKQRERAVRLLKVILHSSAKRLHPTDRHRHNKGQYRSVLN